MPTAPARPCTTHNCRNLQPCPTHARKPWARTKRMPGGNGWQWQRIRKLILDRDGHTCQIRAEGCTGRAEVIDHIVGIARGGTDDPSNLRAACANCNERKRRIEARQ